MMTTIDSFAPAQIPAAKPVESVAPRPAPAVDAVMKTIRDVSAQTQQVNAQIAEQRNAAAEQMEKMKARLDEAIRTLNESIDMNPNNLQFSVDAVSKKIMVVVTDQVTGETVRQVPAEALLRVAHNIEAMKGILFDKVL